MTSAEGDDYYGIVDLPLNPNTVSLGTLNIPANVCVETLVFGPNSSFYLSSMDFVVMIDGESVWEGKVSEVGKQIGIPHQFSHSETPRLLMIVANPNGFIPQTVEIETTTILVAIKGAYGECSLLIEVPEEPVSVEGTVEEGSFGFDAEFQSAWS